MSTLAEFSSVELVVPELENRNATRVVEELCSRLHRAGRVTDRRAVFEAVLQRESMGSTACAPGWALPHARLEGIGCLSLAVGRSSEPLPWFGLGEYVRLVFLFAVPPGASATYLAVASALARLSLDRARREQLLCASDSEAMLQVLQQVELRQPRAVAARAVAPVALAR